MKIHPWTLAVPLAWAALLGAAAQGREAAWEMLNPKFGNADFSSIAMDRAGTIYAVADSGKVLRSEDGGATWRILRKGTELLDGVHFQASGLGIAVGKACILRTVDSGRTWSSLAVDSSVRLLAAEFPTDLVGIAVGMKYTDDFYSHGFIVRTEDGGINWKVQVDTLGNDQGFTSLKSIHFPVPDTGYASGQGLVAKSTDGGKTWSVKSVEPSWGSAVHFTDARTGYLAGMDGFLGKTTDGGATWTGSGAPSGSVSALHFPTSRIGYAVGSYGLLRKTIDGGLTWDNLPWGGSALLRTVHFSDADHGLAAGRGGIILRTQDGGSTWSLPGTATDENIAGLHFRDGSRGTFLVSSGNVFATTDGASTWSLAPRGPLVPRGTHVFSRVHFPHPDIGYAIGNTMVAKTRDGGVTWDSSGSHYSGTGVHFVNRDTGYIVGGNSMQTCSPGGPCSPDRAVYYRTRDGGKSWQYVFSSAWPMVTMGCADAEHCYSAGYDGQLFRINRIFSDTSATGILNNPESRITGTRATLQAMDFPDSTTGYVAGSGGTILKTEDAGLTWRQLTSGSNAILRAVKFIDARRGFVAGIDGILLYTSDGGLTWELQPKLTIETLTSLECPSQDTCFAAGDRGVILQLIGSPPSPILRRATRPSEPGRGGKLRWEIRPVSGPATDLLGRSKQARGRASGIGVLPAP